MACGPRVVGVRITGPLAAFEEELILPVGGGEGTSSSGSIVSSKGVDTLMVIAVDGVGQ
jgi:hypothetical protein